MLIVTRNFWIDRTRSSIGNFFFIKLGDVVLFNGDETGIVLKLGKVVNGVDFTTWEIVVLINTCIRTRQIWLDER